MKKNNAREYDSPIMKKLSESRDPIRSHRVHTKMGIAARIQDMLTELGWKQRDLAERLGKQDSEITRWLSGVHNFTVDTLSDIEFVTQKKIFDINPEKIKEVTFSSSVTVDFVVLSRPGATYASLMNRQDTSKSGGWTTGWVCEPMPKYNKK